MVLALSADRVLHCCACAAGSRTVFWQKSPMCTLSFGKWAMFVLSLFWIDLSADGVLHRCACAVGSRTKLWQKSPVCMIFCGQKSHVCLVFFLNWSLGSWSQSLLRMWCWLESHVLATEPYFYGQFRQKSHVCVVCFLNWFLDRWSLALECMRCGDESCVLAKEACLNGHFRQKSPFCVVSFGKRAMSVLCSACAVGLRAIFW